MHTGGRRNTRRRGRPFLPLTIFAALSAAAVVLAGFANGISSSPPAQLLAYHRIAPSKPAAGPYLALMQNLSGEIASHIGHPLSLKISVVFNSTQQLGSTTEAYADAQSTSGSQDAPATKCVVSINPTLYHARETALVKFVLAHEMFHCFEAMDYPTVAAFGRAPDWLIEGEAEWVGDTLAPREDTWWDSYLSDPKTSLFSRSYNAIGFYSLMTQSGDDTWHLLDPMLKAGGNAAAYAVAANSTLELDWASSLARQSSFGEGWDANGPGITDEKYNPATEIVSNGKTLTAKVAPYTNALIKFNPSADVIEISPGTKNSRLHESTGSNLTDPDDDFCVHECDECPEMKMLPKLESGTNWLAVTGSSSGATYSVAGKKAMCNESCMVGNWMVTDMTVTAAGQNYSGGAGTEVDIALGGEARADFTPGAPIGALKFNGIETAQYGFPSNPAVTTGTISVSNYDVAGTEISVDGHSHGSVDPGPSSGTFDCTGTTGLTLDFPAGSNGLEYTMVRSGDTATTTP